MKYEEKNKLYKKCLKKYGDILTEEYIFDEVLLGDDPYFIEANICTTYIEELSYNRKHKAKYNFNI